MSELAPNTVPPDRDAATIFKEEWRLYHKVLANNYLFHREAYATLHNVLLGLPPFSFLDIACGDASATVGALAGTRVADYRGLDLSAPALDLARVQLASLPCPATLELVNFVEAVRDPRRSADVAWIGLSLHHLRTPEKRDFMRDMRRLVGDSGQFLIYEDASPDGETRDEWLARWDAQRSAWTAYTDAEWARIDAHVHGHDFPETDGTWLRLGREAGFGRARCLYVSPTDLLRLYCYEA